MENQHTVILELQIADAAFSFDQTPAWSVNSFTRGQFNYTGLQGVTTFDDSKYTVTNKLLTQDEKFQTLGLNSKLLDKQMISQQALFGLDVNKIIDSSNPINRIKSTFFI